MDNFTNNHINYIEFGATDLPALKKFYSDTFGWTFTDYGPEYAEFGNAGITGGFTTQTQPKSGGPLVILYEENLEIALEVIEKHGGKISQSIFSFPGGRRFHFCDPSGNQLGVWSKS